MWQKSFNNLKIVHKSGTYTKSDRKGTVSFTGTLEFDLGRLWCIYLIKERNSGLMYIGKAKRLHSRAGCHRHSILSAIDHAKRKRKINSYT